MRPLMCFWFSLVCVLAGKDSGSSSWHDTINRKQTARDASSRFPSIKNGGDGVHSSFPAKYVPEYGIPMQATPFPYKLLRPRFGDHYEAMPLALQRAMNPRLPPIVLPSPVVPQPRWAVAVSCFDGKMFVRVDKFLCGFGCKDSDLILGKGCTSTSQFGSEVIFEYSLQRCDTKAQVVNGMLVYSNTLYYKPLEPKGPIRRSSPFSVTLLCSYERLHHSYKLAYHPIWNRGTYFRNLRNQYSFTLHTMNADFSATSTRNKYYLGQPIAFQATAYFASSRQKLFVQSCHATASPDPFSPSRHILINNLGCMVDGKDENCASKFVLPRTNDTINFIIEAFQFHAISPRVYVHCELVVTDVLSKSAKSCNYDKVTKRWYELEGRHALCSCCDSQCAKDTGSKHPKVKRMMSNGPLQILASEDEQTAPHHLSDLHEVSEDFPVHEYLNVGKNFKPEDEQLLSNDLGNDLENQEASFEMVHEPLSEEIQHIDSERNPLLDQNGAESNTFHSFRIRKMSESESSGFKLEEKMAIVDKASS
ncbi:zona pellucida sperm-binding protein 3-like isoform X2 [Erpetoichthys calabaricus]|uniref:zona pellucida sperm-binding protein 3-like isoform X2 n=1 Tax=Erpetoichthys calabaricus TaxID=27687 RepID=UPI0010A0073C|nr:zona pellucida sperm-binding protein 3-like isoform X2 [Erpetoichthys calabaricus]